MEDKDICFSFFKFFCHEKDQSLKALYMLTYHVIAGYKVYIVLTEFNCIMIDLKF